MKGRRVMSHLMKARERIRYKRLFTGDISDYTDLAGFFLTITLCSNRDKIVGLKTRFGRGLKLNIPAVIRYMRAELGEVLDEVIYQVEGDYLSDAELVVKLRNGYIKLRKYPIFNSLFSNDIVTKDIVDSFCEKIVLEIEGELEPPS